jgi:poly(3-hydroxybutyrate) depolymerase
MTMHVFRQHFDTFHVRPSRPVGATCTGAVLFALVALPACSRSDEEATDHASERLIEVPAFEVDLSQTSVSGLSSGGFMAVQFHVAFSSIMKGVAVFAGGPFSCAEGSVATALTTCMSSSARLDPARYVATTKAYENCGAVDPIANLQGQRVFLFGGADDTTVNPAVMDGLRDYYATLAGMNDIAFERRRANTAHTMPTTSYGGDCASTASPYIGNCGYDGAGEALTHIYGPLAPPAAVASGSFVSIPQSAFIASPSSHSLAETAWAYVPTSCSNGEACRIHVAFHGCKQSTSYVGDAFYKHAGYNEWAETNHLIVLYPQTIAVRGSNPNGCWDWFGYDSPDYAKKTGPQVRMVKAIIDHLAGSAPSSSDAGVPDSGSWQR